MDEHKGKMDDTRHSQNDVEEGAEPKKRARQRKKLLIDRIRLQMEFYFSAANLSKDQFMNKLLKQSPYIDVEVFLKFNRLRALSEDVNLIKKAISKSQILELSDDGMKVKRAKEVKRKENEMECTIYVENIPSHADHEWVHEIFAQYGTIDYISLPHFKSTGRPKGFAFIEFQTPEISNIALEAFGAVGCKISQDLEPSELQSIRTYGADNEQKQACASEQSDKSCPQSLEKKITESHGGNESVDDNGSSGKEGVGKKKRKRDDEGTIKSKRVREGDSESEVEVSIEKKSFGKMESSEKSRIKTTNDFQEIEENVKVDKDGKKLKSKKVSDSEQAIKGGRGKAETEKEEGTKHGDKITKSTKRKSLDKSENSDARKSKKQKADLSDTMSASDTGKEEGVAEEMSCSKTKNKKKKRKRNKKEKMEAIEGVSLKVMSKKEWVRLRNQYLNAQRLNMKHLKEDLHKRRTDESIGNELHQSVKSKNRMPKFTPNAVIKISFEGPPQDPKKLQETIREGGLGGVAYVETSPAEKDVFVRFFSAEAASAYLKAGLWSRMVLLSGNEEKEYWDRCVNAWQKSRNTVNKSPKLNKENRGKEKLLQRALKEACMHKPSTHITFDD